MSRSMISPAELLVQLKEMVDLIIASAAEQEAWAEAGNVRVPAEEVALQLYDAVPAWFQRLTETGMIDQADREALGALERYIQSVQGKLFSCDGVAEVPEWERVRELARNSLSLLCRSPSEKDTGQPSIGGRDENG